MYVSSAGRTIFVEEVASKHEVLQLVQRSGTRIIGDYQEARSYVRLRDVSSRNAWDVVLCTTIPGAKPHMLIRSYSPQVVIGCDQEVIGFDLDTGNQVFALSLVGPFQGFVQVRDDPGIIVLSEVEVVAISHDGRRRWSYFEDLIEDYSLEGNILTLSFHDGRIVRISVLDGVRYG